MKVRTLQVEENKLAQIRVESRMARLSIKTPIRKIRRVQQPAAKMQISREYSSIDTDMDELRNHIGLKDSATLTRDMAMSAMSQAEQAIRTIQRKGDYIAALPHSGNPIAQLVLQDMLAMPEPLTGNDSVVDPTVDVTVNRGSFSIDWSIQDVRIVWDDYQAPVITVDPKPEVNVEFVQEPRLTFKVVEQSIPPEAGRTIDAEA